MLWRFIRNCCYGQIIWLYSDCKYSFQVESLLDYNQRDKKMIQEHFCLRTVLSNPYFEGGGGEEGGGISFSQLLVFLKSLITSKNMYIQNFRQWGSVFFVTYLRTKMKVAQLFEDLNRNVCLLKTNNFHSYIKR